MFAANSQKKVKVCILGEKEYTKETVAPPNAMPYFSCQEIWDQWKKISGGRSLPN
jgi:hypothetical protein